MVPIRGVYEVAVRVKDLSRAEPFYRDVLGLELGIRDAERRQRAAELLRARGVAVQGPVVHDWMPATSLYFGDPDGNSLELCAPARG